MIDLAEGRRMNIAATGRRSRGAAGCRDRRDRLPRECACAGSCCWHRSRAGLAGAGRRRAAAAAGRN